MNFEHKKRIEDMHDSMVVFGKDGTPEGTPEILPGELTLSDILKISSEDELDRIIASQLPSGVSAFNKSPRDDGSRFELKRFVLARLMGIANTSKGITDTFDFVTQKGIAEGTSLPETLSSRMNQCISIECKKRIEHVRKIAARESGILRLSPANQMAMDSITRILEKRGLQQSPPMTQTDIVNIFKLPHHNTAKESQTGQNIIDIGTVLKLYQICLESGQFSWDTIAERLNRTNDDVRTIYSRFVGKRGKDLLRVSRGFTAEVQKIEKQ